MTPDPTIVQQLPPGVTDLVTTDELINVGLEARVELAHRYADAKDILNWGRIMFPEKFRLPFCHELHDYFVQIRGEEFTCTEAPRGHAKSTIKCFLLPIFAALNEPETFNHYLNVQATGIKSFAVNLAIKLEIENNPLLRAVYGNQVGLDKWSDGQFALRNGVIFTAVGAGQSIRGLNYRNVRPDYIIIDDLYDEEDINNPEATIKKNEWFWGSLFPARAKSRRCSLHIQGTAINTVDLLEELKSQAREKGGTWHHRTFRAIKNWDTHEVLWKELNTFESLMRELKFTPEIIFAREMQNERRDSATAIIKSEWLENWEKDWADLKFRGEVIGCELHYVGAIIGIDPSVGRKETNDFTGLVLVLKAQRDGELPTYWIESAAQGHWTMQERVDKAKDLTLNRPPGRGVTKVIAECISAFLDWGEKLQAAVAVPCTLVDHVKDKITNLERKSLVFQNKRIFINKSIDPEVKKELKHQLVTVVPRHDDLRDALLLTIEEDVTSWKDWV